MSEPENRIKLSPDYTPSKWKCELFGCGQALVLNPSANKPIPNYFWRWMQFLCFGNRWIKSP